MACYVIGDVHGCFSALDKLLEKIQLTAEDRLIFLGDYVARGSDSLGVLRLIMRLPNAVCLLGNHDLHLLYYYYVTRAQSGAPLNEVFEKICQAEEEEEIFSWLSKRPLAHLEKGCFFSHAGLFPQWTSEQAQSLANEVAQQLVADPKALLVNMYGNEPSIWDEKLTGSERWRFIINALTRMRYLNQEMRLDFIHTNPPHMVSDLTPWYEFQKADDSVVYFGHWAALQGKVHTDFVHALDGGCVWGGSLLAMELATDRLIEVKDGQ